MVKKILLPLILVAISTHSFCQSAGASATYRKMSFMIPMRDGVLLNTIVLTPVDQHTTYPFLINRTPYGIDAYYPEGNQVISLSNHFPFYEMATEGYIFVFQDIRGRYKSQGKFEIHEPLIHAGKKDAVDESTDTWDTIEWLLHH